MKYIKTYEAEHLYSSKNPFNQMKQYIIWENRDGDITFIKINKITALNINYSIIIPTETEIVLADQEISKNFFLNSYINNIIHLETNDFNEALDKYKLLISANKYNL